MSNRSLELRITALDLAPSPWQGEGRGEVRLSPGTISMGFYLLASP
jgi:hypothetical protein